MFLLFVGMEYYPSGGWNDYQGKFETVEDALEKAANIMGDSHDWWHIVHDGVIIKSGHNELYRR